jgi:hypothetical protein
LIEEPLVYTSLGNVLASSLEERVVWVDNDEETICAHEHWHDGECVKRAVHIYKRKGLEVLGQLGDFGG